MPRRRRPADTSPLARLGTNIRSMRLERGMTQQELADGAQCHPNYVGELERGKVNATSENLLYIASALRVLPETLWRGYTLLELEGLGEKSQTRLKPKREK